MLHPEQSEPDAVGEMEQQAETERRPCDDREAVAPSRAEKFGDRIARRDHRDGGDAEIDDQADARMRHARPDADQPRQHTQHVPPQIRDHREQGAHMHRDVDRQPLIGPAGQQGNQPQMSRRADRQELGKALQDRDYGKLKQRQPALPPFMGRTIPAARRAKGQSRAELVAKWNYISVGRGRSAAKRRMGDKLYIFLGQSH